LVVDGKMAGRQNMTAPAAPAVAPGVPALPLLGIALYLAYYMAGLNGFGQIEIAPRVTYVGPLPHLTLAAVISFGVWRYAAARLLTTLACAAALFVMLSLVSIGQIAAMRQVYEAARSASLNSPLPMVFGQAVVSITASILTGAAVMLVAGAVAPRLHKDAYWVIAVILWPIAGYLVYAIAQGLTSNGLVVDRSYIPHVYFAAFVIKQSILFASIGSALDDSAPSSRVFDA
jgi:hypothetical protein